MDSHSSTHPAAVTSLISMLKRYLPEAKREREMGEEWRGRERGRGKEGGREGEEREREREGGMKTERERKKERVGKRTNNPFQVMLWLQ